MTRRLVLAMTALAAVVALALAIPLAGIVDADQRAAFMAQLEVDALSTASIMSSELPPRWESTALEVAQRTGARVIVVDTNLTLLVDSDQSDVDRSFDRPEIREALAGKVSSDVRYSSTLGEELRYVAAPIVQDRSVVAAVRLSLPESDVEALVNRTRVSLVIFVVAVVIAAGLVAWIVAYSIASPLRRLAGVAEALPDDLALRAEEDSGPPEVRSVAAALNKTAARLSGILRRQERVAAEASHHLRTPLTGVRLRLEAIEDVSADEGVRHDAQAAIREVDRLSRRIEQVLALARSDAGQSVVRVDVRDTVENRVEAATGRADAHDIVIGASFGPGDLRAWAPVGVLDRAVDELLANAVAYAQSRVTVNVRRVDDRVELAVTDDGAGVAAEELDTIFDRFVRGERSVSGGSGLGLAMVRESARAAGGDAYAENVPGAGLRVVTTWPAFGG